MKCCICGKEIDGWGNNPWGVTDASGKQIEWGPEDECCDDCNLKYVIFGRLIQMKKNEKYN